YFGFRIGEVSSPARYFPEASSISFSRSVIYGIGVLKTALKYRLQKQGLREYPIFDENGKGLLPFDSDGKGKGSSEK
ncbi:MAG: glycosyltransferase family 2 protein, partial [Deltaproteobacteria bacterium]|nr:glycosyltransferase family 2 protein [Deltaproteobacteria bacterium]